MANTPWPPDNIEDPHVYASHDGMAWEVPPGLTNPLNIGGLTTFNSDTELLYMNDRLYVVWRGSAGTKFLYRSSLDGVTWAPTVEVPDMLVTGSTIGLSPALWWDADQGQVHMWVGVSGYDGPGSQWDDFYGRWRRVLAHRTAPSLDGPWSAPTMSGLWTGALERSDHWHHSVTRYRGVWYGCFGGGEIGWGGGGPFACLASSRDGVTWAVGDQKVLHAVPGTWMATHIYRPCIRVSSGRVRLWFSAMGPDGSHTSYTELPTSWLPEPPPD